MNNKNCVVGKCWIYSFIHQNYIELPFKYFLGVKFGFQLLVNSVDSKLILVIWATKIFHFQIICHFCYKS